VIIDRVFIFTLEESIKFLNTNPIKKLNPIKRAYPIAVLSKKNLLLDLSLFFLIKRKVKETIIGNKKTLHINNTHATPQPFIFYS